MEAPTIHRSIRFIHGFSWAAHKARFTCTESLEGEGQCASGALHVHLIQSFKTLWVWQSDHQPFEVQRADSGGEVT